MTTTTPTARRPYADELEVLSWHLRANPQLETPANINGQYGPHLCLQLHSDGDAAPSLAAWAQTLTAVTASARVLTDDKIGPEWFIHVLGTMADVPVDVWGTAPVRPDDTQQSVEARVLDASAS